MKKFVFLAALAAASVAALAQDVDPNRVVATVNGEPIKGSEYYHRMEFLPGVGKVTGSTISEFPPGFLTIEQLITEHLVLQLAKQKGVLPTDAEVDNELQARMQETPDLVKNWETTGRTEDELKYQIKLELAQFKIATFGVTFTDQEIEKYYKDNPDMFTTPKQYKLSVIVVQSDADKKPVDDDLAGGKSFADVARARSADITKSAGGAFGTIDISRFNPTTQAALAKTKIGDNTDWLSTTVQNQPAFLKFHVDDVLPAKLSPLDDALRREIRRRQMLAKGSTKNDIEGQMIELRKKSKIDINQPVFADAYKKFIEAYLSQPHTATGGAPSTGANGGS